MSWLSGLESIVRRDEPLAMHTWFQIGGPAEYFEYKISMKARGVARDPGVVPLPAGLPLLLAALGVFGLIRRKV